MAAIIRANAALLAGNMAVLKRDYGTDYEGIFFYDVTYVCLEQFLDRHINKFRPKMPPPTAMPANFSLFNFSSEPVLWDVSITSANGLSYIAAKYSTNTNQEITVTQTSEERAYYATKDGGNDEESSFISFDYIAVSVTVTSVNTQQPAIKAYPGTVFNFRSGGPKFAEIRYYPNTIFSSSKSRSSRGQYSFSVTSTGIYGENLDTSNGLNLPLGISANVTE